MNAQPALQSSAPAAFDLSLASAEQEAIFYWFRTGRVRLEDGSEIEAQDLLVRARAGTGKTTTILAGVELAPEGAILLAAFNKSIASELQSRIRNPRVEAKTLHALGFKFCSYNWKGHTVDTTSRRRALLLAQEAMKAFPHLDVKGSTEEARKKAAAVRMQVAKLIASLHSKGREIQPFARGGRDLVDLAVTFNLMPDDSMTAYGWDESAICAAAYKAMILAKQKTLAGKPAEIDFADMIYLPLVMGWVRPWYDLVVVDEAQDMTVAQLELAQRACRRGGRICVVGDDRQAIYAFRGADAQALDNLKKALNAAELGLTITRRCPKLVVALAQALVPDFTAAPEAPQGLLRNCDSDTMISEAREGNFILSRTNAPLVKVCMALLRRGVRARVKGRDIGRGIQALVEKLAPASLSGLTLSLNNWTDREIERATEKLPEGPREERIDAVSDQAAVLHAVIDVSDDLADLNDRLEELFADADDMDPKKVVMCSSVHRAKGLEASRVYLLKGTFRDGSIEEDNIRYVAITRTKHELVDVAGFERAAA